MGELAMFVTKCIGAAVVLWCAILAGLVAVFLLRLFTGVDEHKKSFTVGELLAACTASSLSVFVAVDLARGLTGIHFIPIVSLGILSAWRQRRRLAKEDVDEGGSVSAPSKWSKFVDFLRGE